jgi:hypothetical protein
VLVADCRLAVVSEAMLRLWWSMVEPQKRSEGGCLLRTDRMLGGAHSKSALAQRAVFDRASSTFIKQLSLALEEIADENAHNEP